MNYGWTSPIIPYLVSEESHIKTTLHEAEYLETALMVGSFFGLPGTIYFVNKIGRKKSLLLAAVVNLICWIIVGFADTMVYLFVARFFFGMAANMSFVAAPMYVAEIADQKIRGFLSSITYLMMLVGFIIVYSIGPYTPFYITPVIGCIILLIELSTFIFMPESPYYLLYHQKYAEAKKSLQYFRPNRNITEELDEISKAVERQKAEHGRIMDLVVVPSNRKALIIMTVLNGGQHLVAISVILMNLHSILQSADSVYMDSSHAAILFSVIMLVSAQMASLQVDRYGRKVLLIASTIMTAFCMLALAIYFNLKHNQYDVKGISWIPIASVMVYAFTFKMGLGIVPIIITSEIFTAKLKAIGMTIADAWYVIGAIVSVEIYQSLSLYGYHVPFYVFTFCSFLIAAFTYFYIPETKGKTLEEIQMLLKGEVVPVKNREEAEKMLSVL
ncbi:unnamed protein product [Acanthoscelides obtectus]|nr:unnamed protein product [Acanthoscelides obtectus]CAK1654736.1 Facilitated trehalose transporter Tret1 [Acanthoscelides obtectus]